MADYTDSETAPLAPPASAAAAAAMRDRPKPDWTRFGLSSDAAGRPVHGDDEATFERHETCDAGETNEIYAEDQSSKGKPWWKANFFISEPVLFGTWDGVFTSCVINIFGVLIFLRTGWMVGNAGLGLSILIIFMTAAVAVVAALSAIGVCERCKMDSGGVYFLLAHVMGARFGATIGIIYSFGQAVACSLSLLGFGESLAALVHQDNIWVSRGIAVAILLLLLGINFAGVQWVIRLQLVLLVILFISILDFAVGSFVHTDPEHGFVGYSSEVLANNTDADYSPNESFFTVFGVFFPTATGVFAGINMSGDLRNPSRSIPVGTISAVGVSTFLYLVFALILGSTCLRSSLHVDYMIAEKVSIIGLLFLAGLYVSSVSSGMGGLYGAPRILQSVAADGTIPILGFLSKGRGPNRLPVFSLTVVAVVALLFIFIGEVNSLGPVVTMPFMITYAAVDYAYFVLAMSFDRRKSHYLHDGIDTEATYGTLGTHGGDSNLFGTSQKTSCDMNSVQNAIGKDSDMSESASNITHETSASANLIKGGPQSSMTEITTQPRSWYSWFCNRWVSLLGGLLSFAVMFAIQWIYALVTVLVVIIIYIYIGFANTGVFPGIAEFSIFQVIVDGIRKCCRRGPPLPEQVVVTSQPPDMHTSPSQLTEDNEDFAGRGRYHQSEVVKGKHFDDDYPSDG